MKSVVHRLEADYWDRVDFVYIDRENEANRDVVTRFGINGQPVFILLDSDGDEIQRWFGPVSEGAFREAFDNHLDSAG